MQPKAADTALIRFLRISKHYGTKQAMVELSLSIAPNEFVFVTGPSGAGKSTLLKLMYRGELASQGQVLVDGINLQRLPRKQVPELRRKFGIIFQDYNLIPTKTIFANVALALEARAHAPKLIAKQVRVALDKVGLGDRADLFPPSLSGGEQQKAAVVRALIDNPPIILADEPTGSLDDASAAVIVGMLLAAHRRGATVIVATHDQHMLNAVGGRVLRLVQGRLVEDAQCAPVLIKPETADTTCGGPSK